jgi:membrane associated rhomboid family serine protease
MSITIFIIIATVLVSILGWQNREIFDKLKLNPYMVVKKKEYLRIIGHAFLHADSMHLIFNMITLLFFGFMVEAKLELYFGHGALFFITLYVMGTFFAALPSLVKHKNDHWYNSIGASGAVSAVLFAGIFFEPLMDISLLIVPIPIPGFLFGILYLAYSHYMSRKKNDNINHEAHFAGALFGFIFPILFKPELFGIFINKFIN